MRQKIERIEAEVAAFLEYVRSEFASGREEEFERSCRSLVPLTPRKLVKIDRED